MWSGGGCGECGSAAAGGGATGGESVAIGTGGDPVGLGVTTGMGMTVMGMEEGGREGDSAARGHWCGAPLLWGTLLTWFADSL